MDPTLGSARWLCMCSCVRACMRVVMRICLWKKRTGYTQCIDSNNNTLSYNSNSCLPLALSSFVVFLLLLFLPQFHFLAVVSSLSFFLFFILTSSSCTAQKWWMDRAGVRMSVNVCTICVLHGSAEPNRAIAYQKQRITNDVQCQFYIVKCSSEMRTCIEFDISSEVKWKTNTKHSHALSPHSLYLSQLEMFNVKFAIESTLQNCIWQRFQFSF